MAKEVIEMEVKSNIGQVADGIDKTTKSTKKLAKETGEAAKETKDLGNAAVKSSSSLKKLSVGFGTLLKASGIVFLLQKAFESFQEVLGKNQKVVDFFAVSMTSLSIVFNDFFKFIESNVGTIVGYFKSLFEDPKTKIKELATAITDGVVARFNELLEVLGLVGDAFGKLIEGDFKGAFNTIKEAGKETVDVFTGVDKSFDDVKETLKETVGAIQEYTKSTVEQAIAVNETTKAAARAGVEFAKLNAQFLKDAEIQRQIRDDETKTFAERIEANNKLNDVLAKQQELQRQQIQVSIDAAQAQYDINASEENFIALQEAKVSMLELEETITGQLSEQKTNQVALEKELLEAQNEVMAEGLSGTQRELAELEASYKQKLDMARKAGMDTAALDKQFAKQKKAIIQDQVNAELEAFSGLAGALSALAGENKALAVAQAVIDTYVGANKALAQGGIVGFVGAAAVIASGLANVQKIMSTPIPGGDGGGGGAPTAETQTPAPQMMSGEFNLAGGVEPEPIKAFVVTDEMTNSQDQLANIRRRATI
tara:strand:+ start:811 stop:2430 length:1620 start_codon:yes stop_codon:yes gene_type:complete